MNIIGCSTFSQVSINEVNQQPDSSAQQETGLEDIYEEEEVIPESEVINPTLPTNGSLSIREDNSNIDKHKVLNDIMLLMGKPYKRSGDDDSGFDCSGFILKIFRDVMGIILPRSTREQYAVGKSISRDSLKFGDLIFFKTKKKSPSHVGIYVGDGLFAHASLSSGVTISMLSGKYYKRRYLGARRIVE
ncbi:MAG: C40 family peptidase [Ignavibacteriales bacterium]|nr:C40 family peptidase [Ignavibacteriales bacterium]